MTSPPSRDLGPLALVALAGLAGHALFWTPLLAPLDSPSDPSGRVLATGSFHASACDCGPWLPDFSGVFSVDPRGTSLFLRRAELHTRADAPPVRLRAMRLDLVWATKGGPWRVGSRGVPVPVELELGPDGHRHSLGAHALRLPGPLAHDIGRRLAVTLMLEGEDGPREVQVLMDRDVAGALALP